MNDELRRIEDAVRVLRGHGADRARLAVVLGSGLKSFGAEIEDRREIPFAAIPGWPVPQVEGHGASLLLGTVAGLPVACLSGRVHGYEGHSPAEVVRAVRSLRLCGIPAFLLTNAAGGIDEALQAGDLMRIVDHLNLQASSPLTGPAVPAFGPRFPDQSRVWDPELGARLEAADPGLRCGVYAGLPGPSYETPAEVRMLRILGASAVGMSTVPEAIALNAMGARVAGISLISNLAAGIAPHPLSHDEVVRAGRQAEGRLRALVTAFCRSLAAAPVDERA
jgi:purine-nucleoside phosphorylase